MYNATMTERKYEPLGDDPVTPPPPVPGEPEELEEIDVAEELPNTAIQKIEDYIPVLIIRERENKFKKRPPKEVIYITKQQKTYMESLWLNNNAEIAAYEAGVSVEEAQRWFVASLKLREYYRQLQLERAMARRLTKEYLDAELIKMLNKPDLPDKDKATLIRTGYMRLQSSAKQGMGVNFNFVESEDKPKNIQEAETE